MRMLADALALPIADDSVDAVISNPPYPGNGIWGDDWWAGIGAAVAESRRVLKGTGRGWFLVRNESGAEQWLTFDKANCRWAHPGRADPPVATGPGISWGTVPAADVVPLILTTPEGGTVLDPFAGKGGIPKVAARLGRAAMGCDIDPTQLDKGGPYG